jgi:hypothetical protein
MAIQTIDMNNAKYLTRHEACRFVPQVICCIGQDQVIICIWYTLEKQASNYHKTRQETLNLQFKAILVLMWNTRKCSKTHLSRFKVHNLQEEYVHRSVSTWQILLNIYCTEQQMEVWRRGHSPRFPTVMRNMRRDSSSYVSTISTNHSHLKMCQTQLQKHKKNSGATTQRMAKNEGNSRIKIWPSHNQSLPQF